MDVEARKALVGIRQAILSDRAFVRLGTVRCHFHAIRGGESQDRRCLDFNSHKGRGYYLTNEEREQLEKLVSDIAKSRGHEVTFERPYANVSRGVIVATFTPMPT